MSVPHPPPPVKLIVGLLMARREIFACLAAELSAAFGRLDLVSAWLPFHYTSYYAAEMGPELFRRVLAFGPLVASERLAAIKLATNAIEQARAPDGRRSVNIDPGILSRERLVLATGKNYSHRIHLGQGIHADLTLIYRGGAFHPLPWTYPDYADLPLQRFLLAVRAKYVRDLQAEAPAAESQGARPDD
jgi:hypothetical protein